VSADPRPSRERCASQRQRISSLVDGELPTVERLLLQLHLLVCASCRAFRAELVALATSLRGTSLARPASPARPRLRLQPQRLALVGGLGVVGLTVMLSGLLHGTAVGQVGALNPAQGLPVYSTPYRLEGLPVYTRPKTVLRTLAS
jgi:hypothetical protein